MSYDRIAIGVVILALLASAPAAAQSGASRAPALLVTLREGIDFSAGTPEARARRQLSVEIESSRLFPCNLPEWRSALRVRERTLLIDVGRIRPLRRVAISPCSFDRAPAQTSVFLPMPAPGTYEILIRHLGRTDRYTLTITGESIRLAERRVAFSRRQSAELLTRVPPETIALFCAYGQGRSDCAPRRPSCDDLFVDPVITSLTPLPRPAHPYATRELDVDLPHYLAPDVSSLHAHVRERYRDETGCLLVQIVSGRGDLLWNR